MKRNDRRARSYRREFADRGAIEQHAATTGPRGAAPSAVAFAPHVLRLAAPLQLEREDDIEDDALAALLQADHVPGASVPAASLMRSAVRPALDHASEPLPHRSTIQAAFGRHDVSNVRASVGGAAREAADRIGARAFTSGERIGFRDSPTVRLAAHESAHVVQQRQGLELPRGVGTRGDTWERHADDVANAVVAGRSAEALLDRTPGVPHRKGFGALQLDAQPPKHNLTTAALLEMSLTRLDDIIDNSGSLSGMLVAKEIRGYVQEALDGTSKEDATTLREKAVRLNEFLTANQTLFASLHAMDKKDDYLPGIASTITEQVQAVQRKYAVALLLAWRADADREIYELALERADEAMKELPDFIVAEYLGPKGLEAEVDKIRPELDKLNDLRLQVHGAPLRGRPAEEIVWMHAPPRFRYATTNDLRSALRVARSEKAAKHDITNQLQAIKLRTEQALGVIYAMQVYEQLDAYVKELDTWINKGIEIFWKEVLGKMRGYRARVDGIIKTFEDDYLKYDRGASSTGVHGALNALTSLVKSEQFQKDVGAAEDRMKTIAVIKIVGKVVALTALAAVGGAVAAEYAAAAAISMGAAEGGLVAGGAGFVAEVLAFTAVSRAGQKVMFGDVEGTFLGDLPTNALMLGALKAAQAGFTRAFKIFADPKVWKTAHALGKAGAGLVSLQLFQEAHHMATHKGAMMGGEERVRSIIQNVIMVVALEAGRFISEPIVLRLAMPALRVKFAARMDMLGKSSDAIRLRVEQLQRGELSQEDVVALLKAINDQWLAEIKLLADASQKKVISDAELASAIGKYQAAAAQLQLQLSRLNIEAPITAGDAMFKPLETGVVEFANTASALEALKKYYTDRGGTLEPSKRVPDALEGRLPSGELTFFIPEGKVSKAPPDAGRIAAARDAANAAVAIDPMAAEGLARLGDVFGKLRIDEILAAVPPGYMGAFLHMMADPALTPGIGKAAGAEFFINMARSPDAIRFARRYGIELLLNLYRRTTSMEELATVLADVDARIQADPEGTKPFIDELKGAKTAEELAKALGKEQAKTPRPKKPPVRVTKKSLPVDRTRTEWTTVREEAKRDAEDHGQTLSDEELDLRADCELFFLDAKNGRFRRFGRTSKISFLDAFDAVAKRSKMPQSWINAHRGILSEALFNPDFGKPKAAFIGGKQVVGRLPSGATIPDFKISHPTFTEYVNQKSDLIDQGPKDGDVFEAGTAAAKRYLDIAKGTPTKPGEATNLPTGDRYSLDFVRDPGAATQKAMLDILFAADSPVYRVRFGDGPWHTNPGMK